MTTDDLVQRMVERGARDLQEFVRWHDIRGERLAVPGLNDWDALMPSSKGGFQAATRAALLAALEEMREPSEEMCVKGADATGDWRRDVNADTTAFRTFEVMLSHLIERLKRGLYRIATAVPPVSFEDAAAEALSRFPKTREHLAQGIEARRAETAPAGSVGDESPVANGDAPVPDGAADA
jgi:hypothetical protein